MFSTVAVDKSVEKPWVCHQLACRKAIKSMFSGSEQTLTKFVSD